MNKGGTTEARPFVLYQDERSFLFGFFWACKAMLFKACRKFLEAPKQEGVQILKAVNLCEISLFILTDWKEYNLGY
ncbi:hypothetical protein CVD28_23805 [Bacillus sp. M6-12]|uniref:hypothetical protein n=1 Tax=Bacillus sp. M6-12 TaxID=2054166 RepID=UPI000C75CE67|nr:hypothetical protein [Bacillus sp. M6-12]PLS15352.1 hypothetical protein CVD28_23805 [Bacillus sp. M6-12]